MIKSRAEIFPALSRTIDGLPITYLDQAATALKPLPVIRAVSDFYTNNGVNVHRGINFLADEATAALDAARDNIRAFINARSPREIICTSNTTHAIALVANGLRLNKSDKVVCLVAEHHSNLAPWSRVATVKTIASPDPLIPIKPSDVEAAIDSQTKVVAIGHASNVTGVVQPVAEICAIARQRGIVTVVDAAQSVAHIEIDVQDIDCDFLAFSGHKVYGPMGVGVLYGREALLDDLEPTVVGGGVFEVFDLADFTYRHLPEKFEGGTPNVGGILGLSAALTWLSSHSLGERLAHDALLANHMEEVLGSIAETRLLMSSVSPRIPTASIALERPVPTASELSVLLSDKYGIILRSGLMCAHPFFRHLDVSSEGVVRVSCGIYSTIEDIDYFANALSASLKQL